MVLANVDASKKANLVRARLSPVRLLLLLQLLCDKTNFVKSCV